MVENNYGIRTIIIESEAKSFCPLGKSWYTNHFTVKFEPAGVIPDYCVMDKWIAENIEGKELIIEAAVDALYNYLETTYSPNFLEVTSYVEDAKHSVVTITK